MAPHVGLERPLEEIEGDPETSPMRAACSRRASPSLVDELRLSLDYYGAQEGAVPVGRIVLAGPGKRDSRARQRMEDGLAAESASPARGLAGLDDGAAARLTLPYGLALET